MRLISFLLVLFVTLLPATAQTRGAAPSVPVYKPGFEGLTVTYGGVGSLVYVGPQSPAMGRSTTLPLNDITPNGGVSVDWLHMEFDGDVRRITVQGDAYGSGSDHSQYPHSNLIAIMEEEVGEQLHLFPSNVPPAESILSGSGKLGQPSSGPGWVNPWEIGQAATSLPITNNGDDSRGGADVTWEHDPDGGGPMQPVRVRVWTQRSTGESSAGMMKRLSRLAKRALGVFPPNVASPAPPQAPSGG